MSEPRRSLPVPPMVQDPVVASSENTLPLLSRSPTRLIVPPVRAIEPIPAVVKLPPRLSAEFLTTIWPALDQLVSRLSVPPAAASTPPTALVNDAEPRLLNTRI